MQKHHKRLKILDETTLHSVLILCRSNTQKKKDDALKMVPKTSCKSSPQNAEYPGIYFQKITVKQYKEPLLAQNQDNPIYCANTVSILVPTISLLSKKYYTSNSPAVTI